MGELGKTLHAWRDRVSPAEVGLTQAGVRRAPGLRREELAQLAGLSVDYVIRLEQGRSSTPSVQVLTALARALRLTDAERNHLFVLAGQVEPSPGHLSASIPPGVQRLLDQLEGAPLSVCDASWNMINYNALWAALMGDPSQLRGRDRNIIWRHFSPDAPTDIRRIEQTPEQAENFRAAMVTDLRTASARYPKDAGLHALIKDLRRTSETFGKLWDERPMAFHGSERKVVHHPEVGELVLDCDVLTTPGNDLRLVVYTAAPGSDSAEKLRLLSVIGLQPLSTR